MTDPETVARGLTPSRVEYVRRYSDDSGVEVGVIYASDDMKPVKVLGVGEAAEFSVEHLDFMIDALAAVRSAILQRQEKKG